MFSFNLSFTRLGLTMNSQLFISLVNTVKSSIANQLIGVDFILVGFVLKVSSKRKVWLELSKSNHKNRRR